MPDPRRETVSASQMGALFNVSPYATRFQLWHEINGSLPDVSMEPEPGSPDEDERMMWGRLHEPLIVQATGKRMDLIVDHHTEQTYTRHPTLPVGCTRDADILCPNRGRGVVEAKSTDWLMWKDRWTEDEAPAWVELQVHAQMMAEQVSWGVISCLVGGNELRLYERERDIEVQNQIGRAADEFMQSVRDQVEPDPFGSAVEEDFLKARWPGKPEPERLDVRDSEEAYDVVRQFHYWHRAKSTAEKNLKDAKAKLLALAKDADEVRAYGYAVTLKRSHVPGSAVRLPAEILVRLTELHQYLEDDDRETVAAAIDWSHEIRKDSHRVLINANEISGDLDEPPLWGEVSKMTAGEML